MSDEKIAVIILAAGSSSRMGGVKKEYQKLPSGLTVLETALRSFVPLVDIICITVSDKAEALNALSPEFMDSLNQEIIFACGGDSRRASALNSLRALSPFTPRYVLIHDGARPYVSVPLVKNIIAGVKKHHAVIPLLALTDTPKECEVSGESQAVYIKRHLKRANVGIAQTPQAFRYPEILHAHEKAALAEDEEFTDDAEVWSRFLGKVAAISGEPVNRKITFLEDLTDKRSKE